jgi:hypothetical protein
VANYRLQMAPVMSLSITSAGVQLNESQLAFVALEIEKVEPERAKARMSDGGGDKKSGREQIPHPIADAGKARDKAGARVGEGSEGKGTDRRRRDTPASRTHKFNEGILGMALKYDRGQ